MDVRLRTPGSDCRQGPPTDDWAIARGVARNSVFVIVKVAEPERPIARTVQFW